MKTLGGRVSRWPSVLLSFSVGAEGCTPGIFTGERETMNEAQRTAIENHCRMAFETAHPRFARVLPQWGVSIVLTVNSGWE